MPRHDHRPTLALLGHPWSEEAIGNILAEPQVVTGPPLTLGEQSHRRAPFGHDRLCGVTAIRDLELAEVRYQARLLAGVRGPHPSNAIESIGGRELGGLWFGSLSTELTAHPLAVL